MQETNKPASSAAKRQSSVIEYLDNMDKKIVETVKKLAKAVASLSVPFSLSNGKSNQKDTIEENDFASANPANN